MKTFFITLAITAGLTALSTAQAAIVYVNGPSFPIPGDWTQTESIDLDQDGTGDFEFLSGPTLTTGDPGNLFTPFYVVSLNTNNLLCAKSQAVVLPGGTQIGAVTPGDAVWTNATNGAGLAAYACTGSQVIITTNGIVTNLSSCGWSGSLFSAGDGYLGVRFYASDGPHYGWIHAAFQSGPVVVDWAYETQANVAIAAGAVALAPTTQPRTVRPGTFRLEWQAQIGAAYQVQFKSDLSAQSWTNAGFAIVSTATNAAVDIPLAAAAGFYRVAQTR